jgi:CHAT domain-containing protein
MRGTDFVALSACQTALGDITADGIFGMQRALKMAGVKGMMVSLWSVGDLSSYKLFSYFYEELENQQEKDIHKAWKVARKKLSEYVHYTPYFNIETLEEDVDAMKFDKPNDLFPYILIDIY